MVFDGKWKWELKKLSWAISFWKRTSAYSEYSKHQLNRAILYSAVIIRKAIEEETGLEKLAKDEKITLPGKNIKDFTISAIKFPYIGDEGWTFRGKVCVSSYDNGKNITLKPKELCNWIIHSYVWGVVGSDKQKGFIGFMVASDFDKEKLMYFVSFDEWQKLLDMAIENG